MVQRNTALKIGRWGRNHRNAYVQNDLLNVCEMYHVRSSYMYLNILSDNSSSCSYWDAIFGNQSLIFQFAPFTVFDSFFYTFNVFFSSTLICFSSLITCQSPRSFLCLSNHRVICLSDKKSVSLFV